jgi:hypothetical protein
VTSSPDRDELSALERAMTDGSADNSEPLAARRPADPLGVTAIVVGCIGLVVLGVGLAIVAAVLAAIAGSQARLHGRSLENAYIAFGLAALDGVVWLVLHMLFDLSFVAG